jgi:hypothetical protein
MSAARRSAAIPDPAAERVDDAVADRQPKSRALTDRLGREEGLKQLRLVLGRHAGAGVLDLEHHAIALVPRAQRDAPGLPPRHHDRLLGVDHEVQHHLLELGEDRQRVPPGGVLDAQLDAFGLEPPLPQLDDGGDDIGQPDGRCLARLLPGEQREVPDDAARPCALLLDQAEIGLDRVGHVALHLKQLGKAEDGLQRIVDLVSHSGHELADSRKALLPDHLPLQRLQLLADPALLGHLRVERGARLVEAAQHLHEGVLQLHQLAARHEPALERREVAARGPLRRRVEVAHRFGQAPRHHQRHDEPSREPKPENGEAAHPERYRAVHHRRHRDADAYHPWARLDERVAVHPPDAVDAFTLLWGPRAKRHQLGVGQELPDVAFGLQVAREDAPHGIGNGDHRARRQRQRLERILQRGDVHEQREHAHDA